jgi:anti-sigma-K factor RskA
MSCDRRAEQIGRLEERVNALHSELSQPKSQLGSSDRRAELVARVEERLKALERRFDELTSRLAKDDDVKNSNLASWRRVFVSGVFALAAAAMTAVLLAYVL